MKTKDPWAARTFLRLVVTVTVLTAVAILGWHTGQSANTTVPDPPPSPVVWDRYEVGGLILVNPFSADSLGDPDMTVLPRGAVLVVPRKATERVPEDRSRQS